MHLRSGPHSGHSSQNYRRIHLTMHREGVVCGSIWQREDSAGLHISTTTSNLQIIAPVNQKRHQRIEAPPNEYW